MFPILNRRELLRLGGSALAALFAMRHSLGGEESKTSRSRVGRQASPEDVTTLSWAGDATQNTVEISAYTVGATSVGLAVSLNPDMTGATLLSSSPPNAAGWNKWSVPDLVPYTQYYHQLTDTLPDQDPQPIGDISSFWTLRPSGVACTSRIAVGCCEHNDDPVTYAFDDIVTWAPDRFLHIGDLGYPNDLSTDQTTHMNNWSQSCSHPGVRAVQAITCMDYVASDHDTNGSGQSNRPNYHDPITAANILAWQQVVPARMEDTRVPVQGRYRADVEGNVRFVKLDTRSLDKTDTTAHKTDPRWKQSSMLGSTQLSWLKQQIDQAVEQHQLIVLFSDCAWNGTSPGPPIPTSFSDKWPSYIYERDLISDYAASVGAQLFIVYGDSHGLQQDDGTNEKNGFASIGVGPLDSPLHMHYQDSNQWNYPDGILDGGGPYRSAQHYQRLTIVQEDGSSTITVTADARDCSVETGGPQTVRTMVKTYNL
jgi:phosphodiesterase/alkaline phosphatase D-like protein